MPGLMHDMWPVKVKDYGIGYIAWVLDGGGATAIGPAEFGIQSRGRRDNNNGLTRVTNSLLMFNKGIKRSGLT
jgi:hypothetical protein